MFKWIKANKTLLLTGIAVTAIIPVVIISYEVLIKGEDAVHISFDSTAGLVVILYYLLLILFGIAFFFQWIVRQIILISRLKNQKMKTELLHLKAQVNPHFFFNMLNNLYGWIDENPSTAKELVLKLSEMMRYSIYDGQKEVVTIEEEISFLKNYIELHRIRYHKTIRIAFSIDLQHNMPKLKGFDFLKSLTNPPQVIVTSAYQEYALESYELQVVDYLLKPISFERFVKAINKLKPRIISANNTSEQKVKESIFFQSNKKYIQVKLDDILFAEALGNYCKIVTLSEEIRIREKISELSKKLSDSLFVQVHKSFLVTKNHINRIEGNSITILDYTIPVGKHYKVNVKSLLIQ